MPEPALAEAEQRAGSELGAMAAEVRALADEARDYAEAEFAFQKARAEHAGRSVKGIAVFGVLALVLVYFALMALILGLLIALGSTALGPWGAAIVAFAGLLAIAGLCGLIAHGRLGRMKADLVEDSAL